jgi:hypothetical protein
MTEKTITFLTDLFEVTTPGNHFINLRCFGEDLANWLIGRIQQQGISCEKAVQEDWGWVVRATYANARFTLFVGVMDDSIGQNPAKWQVSIGYERMGNKPANWFRPAPTNELVELARLIQEILDTEPHIQEIQTE